MISYAKASIVLVLFAVAAFAVAQMEPRVISATGIATAGSASILKRNDFGSIKVYEITWVSNVAGNVSVKLPNLYGVILRVSAVPSKTAVPTTYSAVLSDEDGVDLLTSKGASLSGSAASAFVPNLGDGTFNLPMTVGGTMTLTVGSAGSAASGKLVIYVRV